MKKWDTRPAKGGTLDLPLAARVGHSTGQSGTLDRPKWDTRPALDHLETLAGRPFRGGLKRSQKITKEFKKARA